jgi:hypothetical protein
MQASPGRRALAVAGAVAAVTLSAGLVLFAADASAWRQAVRDDDALFQVAPWRAGWTAPERTPFGVARRALGLDDDLRLRHAIRLFELGHLTPLSIDQAQELEALKVRAETGLTDVERTAPDDRDRALAANLLGVLALEEARMQPLNVPALLRRSTDAFRRAIALDPAGQDAKVNLEIVLRLSGPGGRRRQQQVGIFGMSDQSPGAGATRTGRGY